MVRHRGDLDVAQLLPMDASQKLSFREAFRGHYQTLKPFFLRTLRAPDRPRGRSWGLELQDPDVGPVTITGEYFDRGSQDVLVVLHGLGGNTESGYMALAATAAQDAGRSCLLLNSRGADRNGSDIHHSGLTVDLERTLISKELRDAKFIDILGYSIGGHVALRYACGRVDERVRRVAAICSPLHLADAADDFDHASFNVYRSHVMDSLKEIYTAAYQRRAHGILPYDARKISKIRSWDHQIVAPRFGFESAAQYYETQSVAPLLDELKVEALYVGASCDPMVPASSVRSHLAKKSRGASLHEVWDDQAGHVGFTPDFTMGEPVAAGLEPQVLSWLSGGNEAV